MRNLKYFVLTLTILRSVLAVTSVTSPYASTVWVPGSQAKITWVGQSSGKLTLNLYEGPTPENLQKKRVLATDIDPSNFSAIVQVPSDLESKNTYAVGIYDCGTEGTAFSHYFTVSSSAPQKHSASSSHLVNVMDSINDNGVSKSITNIGDIVKADVKYAPDSSPKESTKNLGGNKNNYDTPQEDLPKLKLGIIKSDGNGEINSGSNTYNDEPNKSPDLDGISGRSYPYSSSYNQMNGESSESDGVNSDTNRSVRNGTASSDGMSSGGSSLVSLKKTVVYSTILAQFLSFYVVDTMF